MDVGGGSRRPRTGEGALVTGGSLQARDQAFRLLATEACPDPADMDEVRAAMDAYDQGPEAAAGIRPSSDDDLMPSAAFSLGPSISSARAIRGIGLFRDDPLQRQLAGGEQDGITAGLEMVDVAQQRTALVWQRRARFSLFRSDSGSFRRSSPVANSMSNTKKTRSEAFSSDIAA